MSVIILNHIFKLELILVNRSVFFCEFILVIDKNIFLINCVVSNNVINIQVSIINTNLVKVNIAIFRVKLHCGSVNFPRTSYSRFNNTSDNTVDINIEHAGSVRVNHCYIKHIILNIVYVNCVSAVREECVSCA